MWKLNTGYKIVQNRLWILAEKGLTRWGRIASESLKAIYLQKINKKYSKWSTNSLPDQLLLSQDRLLDFQIIY